MSDVAFECVMHEVSRSRPMKYRKFEEKVSAFT